MTGDSPDPDDIDWSLTTWEGSRREQMRRWAEMSLEEIILAIESLEAVSKAFAPPDGAATLKELDAARGKRGP